eukprot:CAMPEP_0204254850 /NCGR_PEP_ID=MMETSP0468-20130131/2825_1 /ASSEMBLY_ACC=CAM_ASM_000383 /TAXON_ID=2969 /ORGANISM="Oxyrrhis marina" /LENGTH=301 /DNA_ID=CAMNT_0051228649 /DNA_START=83 /DNA_END=988 /DNA_ORIENTATION=+
MKAKVCAVVIGWTAAQELGAALREASAQTGVAAREVLEVQSSLAKVQFEANEEYSKWDGLRRQLDVEHSRLEAEVADWNAQSGQYSGDDQVASAERLLVQTRQKLKSEEHSFVSVRSAWVSHKAAVDESLGALDQQVALARQKEAQAKAKVMQAVEEEGGRHAYIENRTSSLAVKLRVQRGTLSWAQAQFSSVEVKIASETLALQGELSKITSHLEQQNSLEQELSELQEQLAAVAKELSDQDPQAALASCISQRGEGTRTAEEQKQRQAAVEQQMEHCQALDRQLHGLRTTASNCFMLPS